MLSRSYASVNWMASILPLAVTIVLSAVLAFAVATGEILLPVLLVGGGLAGLVALRYPAVGAAAILALAPVEGVTLIGSHSAVKLITIGCVALLLVRVLMGQQKIKFEMMTWLILIFITWIFTTMLWSPKIQLSDWISFTLQGLLYTILINLVRSRNDLRLALWGHVLGGSVLAVLVIQRMISTNYLRTGEVAGLGINLAARLVAISLLLAIVLYQLEKNRLARLLLPVPMLLTGSGVVLALSRGAWYATAVSILVAVAVIVVREKPRINPGQILLFIGVAAALLFALNNYLLNEHGLSKLQTRAESAYTFEDGASNRFQIWQVGMEMFSDAPLWGHGFQSFAHKFPNYLTRSGVSDVFSAVKGRQSHNAYIMVLTEQGLIGLGIFLSIILLIFRKLWRLLSSPTNENTQALAWATAVMVFLLASTTVDSAVDRKYLWYGLSLVVLILRHWTLSRVREEVAPLPQLARRRYSLPPS